MVHVDGWPPGEMRRCGPTDNAVWIVNGGGRHPRPDGTVRSKHSRKQSDQLTVLSGSADALPQSQVMTSRDSAVFSDDVGKKFVHI